MKIFLPLCTATLLLAIFLPLSAAPSIGNNAMQRDEMENRLQLLENALSRQVEGTLREEMEVLFRHLERKLSGQVEDAALATARQERRLTELENELKQLQEEGESADAERRQKFSAFAAAETDKVKAASDKYITLINFCFAVLSVLTPIVLATPMFFGYLGRRSFDKEAENKLVEMDQKLAKMETFVAKGQQHEQRLKQILREYESTSQDKFPSNITQSAETAVEKGTGVEALRGFAVLAQNAKDWKRACLYWEDVVKQDPQDKKALFYLAQCRVFLGGQKDTPSNQRIWLWQQAENFYRSELNKRQGKSLTSILLSYAILKKEKLVYADHATRKQLYIDIEKLLLKAKELSPQNINIFLLLSSLKLERAKEGELSPEDRSILYTEIESLLKEAKNIAPHKEKIYLALATLKTEQADDKQTSPSNRLELYSNAEKILLQAQNINKNDENIFIMRALLKQKKARIEQDSDKRTKLREEAAQLVRHAKEINSQAIERYSILAQLLQEQAEDKQTPPEERTRLQKEAESLLLEAKNISPQDINTLGVLAQFKQELAMNETNPEARKNLRIEAAELFNKIIELDPSNIQTYFMLAQLKLEQSEEEQCPSLDRYNLYMDAKNILNKAKDMNSQDSRYYLLMARLKKNQADYESNEIVKSELLKDVEQLYGAARKFAPYDVQGYILPAIDKLSLSKRESTPASKKLRAEAENLLLQARAHIPHNSDILDLLISIKQEQAKEAPPEEQDALLAAADKYLDELPAEDRAKNLYDRACIAALRGQHERALELLEECRKAGTLPSREHLEQDKDMDSLRDLDAFKEFLEQAYPAEDTRQPDNATKENE